MSPSIRNQAKLAGVALAAAVALTAFGTGTALAQNPHFNRAEIELDRSGNLVCSWKEVGLGNNVLITYDCGAGAVAAFYQCVNRGGGEPRPHTVTDQDLVVTGDFESGKNGQITASLTVPVPPPPSDFCPNSRNWTLRLEGVRWCDAFLIDATNDIVGATEDELSFGTTSNLPTCDELLMNGG